MIKIICKVGPSAASEPPLQHSILAPGGQLRGLFWGPHLANYFDHSVTGRGLVYRAESRRQAKRAQLPPVVGCIRDSTFDRRIQRPQDADSNSTVIHQPKDTRIRYHNGTRTLFNKKYTYDLLPSEGPLLPIITRRIP